MLPSELPLLMLHVSASTPTDFLLKKKKKVFIRNESQAE